MNTQDNIQDELRDLNSSLPVNNSLNPYAVPDGYFSGLADRILAKAKEQNESAADELQTLSPLLAGLSKELPYTAPKGYFEENAARFPFLLNEEESPVLAAIGKTMPYAVPQEYFDTLPQEVMKRIRPKAKVVPFFSRTWTKAAVAALVGGLVFLGGYRLLTTTTDTAPVITAQQPVSNNRPPVAGDGGGVLQDIQTVSTEDLDEFMRTVPVDPVETQRAALAPAEKKRSERMAEECIGERDRNFFK